MLWGYHLECLDLGNLKDILNQSKLNYYRYNYLFQYSPAHIVHKNKIKILAKLKSFLNILIWSYCKYITSILLDNGLCIVVRHNSRTKNI